MGNWIDGWTDGLIDMGERVGRQIDGWILNVTFNIFQVFLNDYKPSKLWL